MQSRSRSAVWLSPPLLTLYSLLLTLSSCAPKAPTLPSGAGAAFPEFSTAYAEATATCGGVNTLTAVMSLSGRVGGQKLRGRIDAGLQAPDGLVLEATAPFGKPFFILGATGGKATLVLPRDERVLRGETPEAIVEALTGVSLRPAELRAVLAGCGVASAQPNAGRAFEQEWAAIDAGDTTTWLRRIEGRWRVVASVRGPMSVHYADFKDAQPSTVRVRMTASGRDTADISLRLSDIERNGALDPKVFEIAVPSGAAPLTLAELKRAGPLGDAR